MKNIVHRRILLGAGLSLLATPAFAAESAADAAFRQALARANASGRVLLVVFHATWCAPCHLMDAFLDDRAARAILDPKIEVLKLHVQERGDKKKLELAGADAIYKRIAGKAKGVPLFAAIGVDGTVIATSEDPVDGNVGFPVTKGELAYFRVFLRKTLRVTQAEEDALIARAVAVAA